MLQKHGGIYVLDGKVLLPGLDYVQAFGKALTHFRIARGAKQVELKGVLGLQGPAIHKIESGATCPNVLQLKLMCMFFDCTPQDVYDLAQDIFNASSEINTD